MKTRILLAAVSAAAIVGCGGDEGEATKTVTVTKTVTATPSPSAVTPTPTPTPPGTGGAIAAEGAYAMKLHQVDYDGVNVTVEHGIPGNESQWQFRTACNGGDCSIQMRRELGSGGFKAVTLRAAAGRLNVFEGTSTGTTGRARSRPGRRGSATRSGSAGRKRSTAGRSPRRSACTSPRTSRTAAAFQRVAWCRGAARERAR
jgi:hypothetical protein